MNSGFLGFGEGEEFQGVSGLICIRFIYWNSSLRLGDLGTWRRGELSGS